MSPRSGAVDGKDFRVPEDEKIDLKKWPTRIKPLYDSQVVLDALQDLKIEYPRLSAAQQKELREIRKLLVA
jgi:hypothetical protein